MIVNCFPFDVMVFAMLPAHGIWRETVSLLEVVWPWLSQWMGALREKRQLYRNKDRYYMTKLDPIVQIGSMLIGILSYRVFFVFPVLINKLLAINLACSSCTVEYWPSVVFVQSCLLRPRANFSPTALALGQFSSVLANGVTYISLGFF